MSTEARRQAAVLRALWGRSGEPDDPVPLWRETGSVFQRGLAAYQGNATATAVRVLTAAYPTVTALLGAEAMAVLGPLLWREHPPSLGDLARWGQALPEVLQSMPALQDWSYLSDCARLDWARHTVEQAQDVSFEPESLQLLDQCDPSELVLQLRPGTLVLASTWPIVTLWQAHQTNEGHGPEVDVATIESLREALAAGQAETAVVWRTHWQARVAALPPSMLSWMRALTHDETAPAPTLGALLEASPDDFDLTQWLTLALHQGWLWRVRVSGPSD